MADSSRPVYRVAWSDEDREWVATADQYPSLSWLDPDPAEALAGLVELISDAVEGTVNKIKMLKRQMYGRAGLPLLRKRVILHAT